MLPSKYRVLARFVAALPLILVVASQILAQQKAPIPDAQAEQAARKIANEIYGGRFQQAKNAADKAALAIEMIDSALTVQNGTADQYILLEIAREVAAGTGEAPTAIRATDELAQRFDVPVGKLKTESLMTAANRATVSSQHKAIVEAALGVTGDLANADEYDTAIKLCEAVQSSAKKAKEIALIKELVARADELREQQKAAQVYRDALAVMDDDPIEPQANLTAGRYLCFVKGDWVKGVPYLALGSDAELKTVAVMELRKTSTAEGQVGIGDAWWAVAETRQGTERDSLRLRAGFWYRQAEPQLAAGLGRLKITQRLAEVSKLGWPIPGPSSRPALAVAPFDEKTAKQHQTAWGKHLNLPVEQTNSIGMTLVLIPPGEFDMGSPESEADRSSSETLHRVRITKPFYLGMYEVTVGQFRMFLEARGYKTEAERDGKGGYGMGSDGKWLQMPKYTWRNAGFMLGEDHPVVNVSWNDAAAFCQWLSGKDGKSYRLPTEAEWEYACRGGTTTPFHFGAQLNGREANCTENYPYGTKDKGPYRRRTADVGSYAANSFGLFDMHGNVWEWCSDWYDSAYYSASPMDDPTGPASGTTRVDRGGAWVSVARLCRSATRSSNSPSSRYGSLGFRVVCELPVKERSTDPAKIGRELPIDSLRPALAVAPFDEKTAKQHQTAWGKHLNLPVEQTNSIGMTLVLIPPGEFDMGSSAQEVAELLREAKQLKSPQWYIDRVPSEAPQHRVRITKPFYLGVCEVTQAEYERLMGSNPSRFKGSPTRPVEQMTWYDAVEFCRRLSELTAEKMIGAVYRLPTEAEWEYACRAGTATRYSFGNDDSLPSRHAWWENKLSDTTQPVGRLKPNAFGLYDMHGNVWEWCSDWYGSGYYGASPMDDPTGPASGTDHADRPMTARERAQARATGPASGTGRVDRGGAYETNIGGCRSAYRSSASPGHRTNILGFRVACTPFGNEAGLTRSRAPSD
jgi:formylglycine-generating enzyme required for sulfatase activity